MAHTMDAIDEWEIIQASINQDHFSLNNPTNHTPLEEEQLNTTNNTSLSLEQYREPEQLQQYHNHLSLTDSEHESSETELDVTASDQEIDSFSREAAPGKKPWPIVWWKFQLNNLFRVFGAVGTICRPFWCVSVVAAVVGYVVLRKRVFGTKHKGRFITTSAKRETQFVASTVQLSQTLSVVRRVPVIKILPTGGDANPWATVSVK